MKFRTALIYGKIINLVIKLLDSSRGSNKSGEIVLKKCPDMIRHFKGINPKNVLFITGTNGKSTTNNLINHILKGNGYKVVSNIEGANLITGICTALIKGSDWSGNVKADYFIFEVDERFLFRIRENLPCDNLLVTNIQKDQVQRNGDPDYIYRKIENVIKVFNMKLFLNNDEPRTRSLENGSNSVISYGVAKHGMSFTKKRSYVTMPCPMCRHSIRFKYYNADGIGSYKCDNCGFGSEQNADYIAENIDFKNATFEIKDIELPMPYNTPYMLYNYAAAIAAVRELSGTDEFRWKRSLETFRNVGGRFEILHYKNKTIKYMRIKQENPETLQTAINVMASDTKRKMIGFGLGPLVDFIPHYAVSFYAFDCDFSALALSDVERYFCFSERVCYDTANRLIYESIDPGVITVADTEDVEIIISEIEKAETDNIYLITWLHTYEGIEKYLKKEGTEVE